ncbi:hypothetical protein OKW32_000595 [Paraburkholderia youngii]
MHLQEPGRLWVVSCKFCLGLDGSKDSGARRRFVPASSARADQPEASARLADLINWDRLGTSMSASFVSRKGRPATSPRLIAGLWYLQHAFDLSDEEVVWQWVENPYWQVFTGETFLQTEPPIDPSSLTRWRKRLGEAGVEELLAETIEAAKRAGVIRASSAKRVIVDTTVMQKAIAHPTDSRLLERCREHLVKARGTARIEAAAEL